MNLKQNSRHGTWSQGADLSFQPRPGAAAQGGRWSGMEHRVLCLSFLCLVFCSYIQLHDRFHRKAHRGSNPIFLFQDDQTLILVLFKRVIYPFERQSYRERKTQRELLHMLVHFPDGHNSQDWAAVKPGCRDFIWVSYRVQGWAVICCFLGVLAESWIRHQAAGAHTGCCCCWRCLTHNVGSKFLL